MAEPISDEPQHFTKLLRDYLLLDDDTVFDKYEIHYWIHRHNNSIIAPYFGVTPHYGVNAQINGYLLKFYPIAFWIYKIDGSDFLKVKLPRMRIEKSDAERSNLIIDYNITPEKDFPFKPIPDDAMILMNKSGTIYGYK